MSSATLFCEARFGRDDAGTWAAIDAANGEAAWRHYQAKFDPIRVAARADSHVGTASNSLGIVHLRPLPYYVGLRSMVRVLHRLAPAIWREVRSTDVVIIRLPGIVGILAAWCCRIRRIPFAAEVVGDVEEVLVALAPSRPARVIARLARGCIASNVKRASAVRYVTDRQLQERYPPAETAAVVAVSDVNLTDIDFAPARDAPAPAAPTSVITIGSQQQMYKGHDVLLRAIALLRSRGRDLRVTVVGDGRYHEELRGLSARLGLGEAASFTGRIDDRARLRGLLDSATVFAMPSRTEGLPRALVEAMARGLPAVGTRIGGIPELLDESCLTGPDDPVGLATAIDQLLTDGNHYAEQSQRNRAEAARYHKDVLDYRYRTWLTELFKLARSNTPGVSC